MCLTVLRRPVGHSVASCWARQRAKGQKLANLGSVAKRLEIQQDFSVKLIDILKAGVGNLVDADLAAESARLQSLQIKQQLGVQALSIANRSPQSILALFNQ